MNKKNVYIHTMYFVVCAIIGWCYEVFLEVVIYKWGFSDRGVLFGPYCPIYGFGSIIFLVCLFPILKNKNKILKWFKIPIVFLGCAIIATLIELLATYILEALTGSWPWQTYADYDINFQARIALSPSLRFGIGGVVFLFILYPLFIRATSKLSEKSSKIIAITSASILLIDLVLTIIIRN